MKSYPSPIPLYSELESQFWVDSIKLDMHMHGAGQGLIPSLIDNISTWSLRFHIFHIYVSLISGEHVNYKEAKIVAKEIQVEKNSFLLRLISSLLINKIIG